jgi:hypothetical protein
MNSVRIAGKEPRKMSPKIMCVAAVADAIDLRPMRWIDRQNLPYPLSQLLSNLVFLVRDFMCAGVEQFPMSHMVAAANNDMRVWG